PEHAGRAGLGARAGHGVGPRRREQAAAVGHDWPAGPVGQERGQHRVADLPAAVPDRHARVSPDRPERRMTDLAAIAAARTGGLAAEADALALADRLVAAKADRARVRADLAQLPGRIAALQQAVAEAQARVAAATQSLASLNAQAAPARAAAAAADS